MRERDREREREQKQQSVEKSTRVEFQFERNMLVITIIHPTLKDKFKEHNDKLSWLICNRPDYHLGSTEHEKREKGGIPLLHAGVHTCLVCMCVRICLYWEKGGQNRCLFPRSRALWLVAS